jgi:hypothetical protein
MLVHPENEMAGTISCASLADVAAVATQQWRAQLHVFNVETCLNGDPVVKMQRIFSKHFNMARHGKAPCHSTI